jgi:hypothetical protein
MVAAELDLLTKRDTAALLRISPRRLTDPRWRQKFSLPTLKVGGSLRWNRAELLQWLERRRQGTGAHAA